MAGQTQPLIDSILDAIDAGALRPGDRLDEDRFMAEAGASRTPMREALIKLETMGLIVRRPRRGAVVFRPSLEEFLAIREVHARLEGQAAGLAARRLGAEAGRRIEAAARACARHLEEQGETGPDRYYQLNLGFHAAVAEAARNPFLLDLIKTNARKVMAYYRARYAYPGIIAASVADHDAIARLILDRQAEAAEAAMARHVAFDAPSAMDLVAAFG